MLTDPNDDIFPDPDSDDFIPQLGVLARRKIEALPKDFTITSYKNGNFVGRHPRGEFRSKDRQWVEDMLWITAAGEA
jgi:hypothetical protein